MLKMLSAGWQWLLLLAILENVGHAATMFMAMPIIMSTIAHHYEYHIIVGINFRGWKNFVAAKSTMKIIKISTPRKLPAIRIGNHPHQLVVASTLSILMLSVLSKFS